MEFISNKNKHGKVVNIEHKKISFFNKNNILFCIYFLEM